MNASPPPAIVVARGSQLTWLSAATLALVILVVVVSLTDLLSHEVEAVPEQRPSVLVSRAGDVANLLILSPTLVITSQLAKRHHPIAVLALPGAVFYVVYVYSLYLLTAPLSPALLGHLVAVVLAAGTVVTLLASIDARAVQRHLVAAPARPVAAVVLLLGLLAYAGLAARMAVMLTARSDPGTRAQWVLDAALMAPPLLLAGVLLWRRHPWGYVLAIAALFLSALGGLAFAVAGLFDTAPGSPGTEPWVIAMNLAVSTVAVAAFTVLVWDRPEGRTAPRSSGHVGRA